MREISCRLSAIKIQIRINVPCVWKAYPATMVHASTSNVSFLAYFKGFCSMILLQLAILLS